MPERLPLLMDSRWVGDAYGEWNHERAYRFLKSASQPRTLWPKWDAVSASGWPLVFRQRAFLSFGPGTWEYDNALPPPGIGYYTAPYGEGGVGIPDMPEPEEEA